MGIRCGSLHATYAAHTKQPRKMVSHFQIPSILILLRQNSETQIKSLRTWIHAYFLHPCILCAFMHTLRIHAYLAKIEGTHRRKEEVSRISIRRNILFLSFITKSCKISSIPSFSCMLQWIRLTIGTVILCLRVRIRLSVLESKSKTMQSIGL